MNIDRRQLIIGTLAAAAGTSAGGQAGAGLREPGPLDVIELWPTGVPGAPAGMPVESVDERSADPAYSDRSISGIARPRMLVHRPQRPNGASVLIMPGGGYRRIVVDKEGHDIGAWLASRGYTAFVLYYRLPGDGWAAGPDVALSDAQRALRLIRHRARDYGIDPARAAALGFSAGGHLCADLAARHAVKTYEPNDAADELSARPLLAAPIYPVISLSAPIAHAGSRERLIGADANPELERAHSPQHNLSDDSPPCFIVHAEDDASVPVQNAIEFAAALRARGIPVESHLFAHGGHGFGLRKAIGKPVAAWPELFVAWSKAMGLV